MAVPQLLLSSRIPSDFGIDDFDLVHHDGRLLAVCVDAISSVYSWDPAADHWRHHRLDMPFDDGGMDFIEISAIAAVDVDGRVVVGGGADHQPFAVWDLETGAVRSHARLDHAGVGRARGGMLGDRPVLVAGDSSVPPRLRIWDARGDDTTEPPEFYGGFESTGDVAVGEHAGTPAVVWGQWDGTVTVWDVAEAEESTVPDCPVGGVSGVGMATIDGEERVVVAGDFVVALADPDTGEWFEPERPEEDENGEDSEDEDGDPDQTGIRCMDVGVLAGRPIAVVGTADGHVQVWDLTTPRSVGEPAHGHEDDVCTVRVAVLDGRTVAITAGRDKAMRVWDLAPVVDW